MSSPMQRRNGTVASCEPCRQGKLRCDHGWPICGRCRRRSRHDKCRYHPAPLTKARVSSSTTWREDEQCNHLPRNAASILATTWTSENNEVFRPTYTVNEHLSCSNAPHFTFMDNGENRSTGSSMPRNSPARAAHPETISMIVEILTQFRHLDLISKAVHEYYSESKASNIPAALILPAISSLSRLIDPSYTAPEDASAVVRLDELAQAVITSTSREINLSSATTETEFLAQYCGENLRLEYIGLICALAARSQVLRPIEMSSGFAMDMFRYSTFCLELARSLTPMNDCLLWLSLETLLLDTNFHGDTSEVVWRHLGDLSSDVFTVGIHREASITLNTPSFLSECRRRTFARAYYIDVSISTLLDRPPRILLRYSDCRLPVDLLDETFAETPEGWNHQSDFNSAAFIRARYIAASLREDILHREVQPTTPGNLKGMQELLSRNQKSWRDLSSRLTVSTDRTSIHVPADHRILLNTLRLSFVQNEFHIQRTIQRGSSRVAHPLLQVSSEMLGLVLDTRVAQGQTNFIHEDSSYIMLNYGVPAATILTTAIENTVNDRHRGRDPQQYTALPPELSPASLTRSLSVFAYQLANTSTPLAPNYGVCMHAYAVISRTLDNVLKIWTGSVIVQPGLNAIRGGDDDGEVSTPTADQFDLLVQWPEVDFSNWLEDMG